MSLHQLTQALKASLEAQATTEDLTPNAVEPNPVDREPATEPNQAPADGATATVVVDPAEPSASTAITLEAFFGLLKSLDEKIEKKKRKISEYKEELKKLEVPDKNGDVVAAKHLDVDRANIAKLETELKELERQLQVKKDFQEALDKHNAVSTENNTPDGIEPNPADKEPSTEPNQVPAAGATAAVADPDTTCAAVSDPTHTDTAPDGTEANPVDKEPSTEPNQVPAEGALATVPVEPAAPAASTEVDAVDVSTEDKKADLAIVTEGLTTVLSLIHGTAEPITARDIPFINLAVEGLVGRFDMAEMLLPSMESVDNDPAQYVAQLESRINTALACAEPMLAEPVVAADPVADTQ